MAGWWTRPKVLEHQNISEYERESFLKLCSKRLLRCLRHEVSGCNIAMQPGGWVPVSEAVRGLSREFNDHDSQNPKRDLICVLEFANQGILPNSYEPCPRIQFKCVQKGYTPDNPETPEQVQNFLGLNLEQFIPFHGAKIPFEITHMRAGHGMTRRENRSATVPNRVWYTTDYTPVNQETLRTCGSCEDTQKMEIPSVEHWEALTKHHLHQGFVFVFKPIGAIGSKATCKYMCYISNLYYCFKKDGPGSISYLCLFKRFIV